MAIGDCARFHSWVLPEAADISKHNIHTYEATIRTYDKNMGGKNTHFFGVLLQKRIEAIADRSNFFKISKRSLL